MFRAKSSKFLSLASVLGAITLASCDAGAPLGDSGSISVRLEPAQLAVNDGGNGTLQVFRKGSFGSDQPLPGDALVRWESSEPAVAEVARGVVIGHKPGRATITADVTFSNGLTARLTSAVTVRAVPTRIEVVHGDGQTGEVAQPLPDAIEVRVLDRHGVPMPEIEVTFTPVGGSDAVRAGLGEIVRVTANPAGLVKKEWVLAPKAGNQQVETTASTSDSEVKLKGPTLNATARPARPAAIQVTGGDQQAGTVGSTLPHPLRVRVVDQFGNGVPDVSLSWRVRSGGGALQSVSAASDADGYGSAQWRLGTTAGDQEVSVNVNGIGAPTLLTATAEPPPATRVTIASGASLGALGATAQLTATARAADGSALQGATFTWGSVHPGIATVDREGRVTAVANGTARVFASRDGTADTVNVIVNQVAVSVGVSPSLQALVVGDSVQLNAVARDANNHIISGVVLSWSSSAAAVASVSSTGRVKGVAAGSAVVTATTAGKSGSAQISVAPTSGAPAVTTVTIEPGDHTIDAIGHHLQLSAIATDGTGNAVAGATVQWSTLNSGIVSVNSTGRVTSKAIGKALVVALAGAVADTTEVLVQQVPASLQLQSTSLELTVGQSQAIATTVKDAAGVVIPNAAAQWRSSSPGVATVASSGTVAGVAEGTAAVTAEVENLSATAQVKVGPRNVESVTLSSTSLSLLTNGTHQLRATVRYADGTVINDAVVSWSSSASTIASVSSGLVRGVAAGTATITAATGGRSASALVTVTASPPVVDGGAQKPELPRVYLDTRMPTTNGRIITVPAGGDLQAALNTAQRGDIIELAAGATYKGAFTLPAKSGSGWIVIRSSRHAQLPEGARVRPSQAGNMPRIVGGMSNQRVLLTAQGASHWRLVGLNIELAKDETLPGVVNTIVELTFGSSNIVIDRSYINGRDGQSLQRCVVMNNAASAVIDSWLDRCHAKGFDSQAIIGWKGPGPFKIVNNHLAGAGENVMFGGAAIRDGRVPADIEIRRNHMFKPLSWQGLWTVKNLFELKIAERVLVEGNVFENLWPDAQVGFAFNLKSENHDQTAMPNIATRDVTIRNNRVINSRFGVQLIGGASSAFETGAGKTERILIENNIFELYDTRGYQFGSDLNNVWIVRNTMPDDARIMIEQTGARLFFTNNVGGMAKGSGVGEGTPTFSRFSPWQVTGNAFVGRSASMYPSGNHFPGSGAQAPTSAGADRTLVDQATAGVRQ